MRFQARLALVTQPCSCPGALLTAPAGAVQGWGLSRVLSTDAQGVFFTRRWASRGVWGRTGLCVLCCWTGGEEGNLRSWVWLLCFSCPGLLKGSLGIHPEV